MHTHWNTFIERNIISFSFNSSSLMSIAASAKGARHERTSSTAFFDIPAVTHPYCYR